MKRLGFHISCCCSLLVVACMAACKPPAATTSSIRKDSTHVEYRDREIPVPVPGETVKVTEYIECDEVTNKPKPKEFEVDGTRSKVKGSIDNTGKLTTECTCDSLNLVVHAKDSLIYELHRELKEETKVDVQYEVHWYDKWARAIALLALLYLIYKFKRL